MDTTETNIKMCEKAEEIQPSIQPVHMMESARDLFYDDGDVWYAYLDVSSIKKVWLPRQDQLQEMVGDSIYNNVKNAMFSVLDDIHKFAFSSEFLDYIPLTMEQLWLAFIMKEKYNKVWNGENWVRND